jgi:hypothetical protein
MKKASEFLNLWIAGPCQGGVSVKDLNDEDKFWNDVIVDEETGTHWKSKHLVYQSELSNKPVRIYLNEQDDELFVQIVRNGFRTTMSSDHPLELATNIAAIIEMDVVKQEEEVELPF